MIDDNISEMKGKFYTNDMYLEAEKILKQREEEIERERKEKRDKEIEEIQRRYAEKEKREQEIHRVNSEHNQLKAPRDVAREEVEGGGGFYDGFVNVLTEVGKHSVGLLLNKLF